jgi:hypothetical protein
MHLLKCSPKNLNGLICDSFQSPPHAFCFLPHTLRYKQDGLTIREAQEKIYEKIQKDDLHILFRILRNHSNLNPQQQPQEFQEEQPLEQILQNKMKLSAKINLTKRALKFICCVDGSEGSDLAFKTMIRLWKRHDHVILFHAYDESKQQDLPSLYRANNVKLRYDGQLVERGIPLNQILFQFETKGKYNTFSVLRNYLMMCRYSWETSQLINPMSRMTMIPPDFVLIGYNGRRGKKTTTPSSQENERKEETEEMFFTMGSTTNITFRSLHLPCIICKRQIPYATSIAKTENRTFSRPLVYIMAIDDTTHSKNGLEILLQLIRSCDTLRLVHFLAPVSSSSSVHEEGEGDGDGEGQGEREKEEDLKEENDQNENNNNNNNNNTSPTVDAMRTEFEQELRNTALREKYERVLLNRGPKQTEVQILSVQLNLSTQMNGSGSQSLKEYICHYVNEENPDFFAIAPRKQQNMTSLTEYLIANITTSIILCKN